MIIVSDTTPLISLLKIQKLHLLEALYGTVKIPTAVYTEITSNPTFASEATIIESSSFIEVIEVSQEKNVNFLRKISGLDLGEAEAIILFEELNAYQLLIDEQRGRKFAQKFGINITGTLGILVLATKQGYIQQNEVPYLLDTLRRSNIRISDELYATIISLTSVE